MFEFPSGMLWGVVVDGWGWISVSSSLLEGYDEPEILRSSSRQFCLTGVEAAQFGQWPSNDPFQHRRRQLLRISSKEIRNERLNILRLNFAQIDDSE